MKKLAFALTLVTSTVAFGGVININLISSTLAGGAGSLLTFNGDLVNTTNVVQNLNNANISGLLAGFTTDVTPFFNNTPTGFLAANQTLSNIGLFTVTIPNGLAQGPYTGTFSVFGGPGVNDQTLLGSANFTVQVVPEPATWALILTALVVLVSTRRMANRELARVPRS